MKRAVQLALAAILLLSCASCVNNGPVIRPGITPEPTDAIPTDTPEPTEPAEETPAPTEAASPDPAERFDALGEPISGAEHFIRYVVFKKITVYEEEGDTFLDGIAENSYPETITCSVDVVYYDEYGNEIARARLQTRDGSYLLLLAPGETVVLARILTDMTLTDRDFSLEFNMEVGVRPITV
jgi:hypothetical protein